MTRENRWNQFYLDSKSGTWTVFRKKLLWWTLSVSEILGRIQWNMILVLANHWILKWLERDVVKSTPLGFLCWKVNKLNKIGECMFQSFGIWKMCEWGINCKYDGDYNLMHVHKEKAIWLNKHDVSVSCLDSKIAKCMVWNKLGIQISQASEYWRCVDWTKQQLAWNLLPINQKLAGECK